MVKQQGIRAKFSAVDSYRSFATCPRSMRWPQGLSKEEQTKPEKGDTEVGKRLELKSDQTII